MSAATRNLFARKKPARRAHLEVTALEERMVPTGLTGFSFVEAQGFPMPLATVAAQPTGFQDRIDSIWHDIRSGKQALSNGKTLQQEVTDSIQANAAKHNVSAYDIAGNFAETGTYSAQLLGGATPTLEIHYQLNGNTLNFTSTTNSIFGSYADPTFRVSYDMTLTIDVSLPTTLSTTTTVAASAHAVSSNVVAQTNNLLVGALDAFGGAANDIAGVFGQGPVFTNILDGIATGVAANQQDLSNSIDTSELDGLLRHEAGKGYTHMLVGLDAGGNLLLTGQKPDLVVNAAANDAVTVNTIAGGAVQVSASGQTATYDPGFLHSIQVNLVGGTNTVKLLSVPAGVSVNVAGNLLGVDNVTVGNGSLASIGGPVNVSNTSGTLTVDDSADTANRITTITNNAVQVSGLNKITYGNNVSHLKVLGGSGSDGFFVNSTAAGTPVSVLTGLGQSSVFVGNNGSLAGIASAVDVEQSHASSTSLTIDDSRESGRSATVSSTAVSFAGVPTITYSGLSALNVVGAQGSNTITVTSVAPKTATSVYNTQHNKLTGPAVGQVTSHFLVPTWDLLGESISLIH